MSVAEDKDVIIDEQKQREQLLKSMREEVVQLKSVRPNMLVPRTDFSNCVQLKAGLVADLQNVVQLLKDSKAQTE